MPDVLGRTLAATATVRADVLLIHQSPAQDICLVTSSACASRTFDVLRREFVHDLASEKLHVIHDPAVALITVVGQTVGDVSEIVEHAFNGLARENVRIISARKPLRVQLLVRRSEEGYADSARYYSWRISSRARRSCKRFP